METTPDLPPEDNLLPLKIRRSPLSRRQATEAVSIVLVLGLLFMVYSFYWSAPIGFQADAIVKIPRGSSVSQTAEILYNKQLIRSPIWFKLLVRLRSRDGVVAGSYYFERRLTLFSIVRRVSSGRFDPAPFKVIIPEGLNNREIGRILSRQLPNFNLDKFLDVAGPQEGKLFPDAYFFVHRLTEQDIVDTMTENFADRVRPLNVDIGKSKRSPSDILTMASIIEEEARTPETRRVISGILWNRIDIDMPLQADATFLYDTDKNTYTLTKQDLRKKSPYNSYLNKGLPPTPISNPGLDSIKAAASPSTTPYLFYLSDLSGRMYYAQTYPEHMRNRAKYLYRK